MDCKNHRQNFLAYLNNTNDRLHKSSLSLQHNYYQNNKFSFQQIEDIVHRILFLYFQTFLPLVLVYLFVLAKHHLVQNSTTSPEGQFRRLDDYQINHHDNLFHEFLSIANRQPSLQYHQNSKFYRLFYANRLLYDHLLHNIFYYPYQQIGHPWYLQILYLSLANQRKRLLMRLASFFSKASFYISS